jgi:hypothetical protein
MLQLSYQNGMNVGDIMPSYHKEVSLAMKDPTGACLDCHMLVQVGKA